MDTQLKVAGYILLLLSLAHVVFPRYFAWRTDLAALRLINRQMMWVHTFFLALTLFLIGLLCIGFSADLATTNLGKHLCLGLSIFWGIRFAVQHVVYSPSLWRGKAFETAIHVLFSLLWLWLSVLFLSIYRG